MRRDFTLLEAPELMTSSRPVRGKPFFGDGRGAQAETWSRPLRVRDAKLLVVQTVAEHWNPQAYCVYPR